MGLIAKPFWSRGLSFVQKIARLCCDVKVIDDVFLLFLWIVVEKSVYWGVCVACEGWFGSEW